MTKHTLNWSPESPYLGLTGIGGIGSGLFFALEGNHTLGRNESRPARLLDLRDYCKLHIVSHYVAVMMGASPGGAGFHVLPIGRVGDDQVGRSMLRDMAQVGMDNSCVDVAKDRPTTLSVCFQYPDGAGGNITTSDSASAALTPDDVDQSAPSLRPPLSRYIALADPEVPLETRFHFLRRATGWGCLRVANLASTEMETALAEGMFPCVDLVAMNEDEVGALIGETVRVDDPGSALDRCAEVLLRCQPDIRIVVTLGPCGAYGFERGRWDYCQALPAPVASTAGAGDALLAGVMCALAVGVPLIGKGEARARIPAVRTGASVHAQAATGELEPIPHRALSSALDFGVLLGSFKVTSPHTIHPDASLSAVLAFAREHGVAVSGELANATQERGVQATPPFSS